MENGEESTEGMTEVENKSLDVAEDVKTDEEELPDVVMNAKAPVNNEEKWMLQMNRQRSVASEHEEGEDTDESLLEVIVALHNLQNKHKWEKLSTWKGRGAFDTQFALWNTKET